MTNPFELTCQEIVELVTDYLERRMPAQQRARFEQHVFTCPPCAIYLEQMKSMVALAGTLDEAEAPEPAPAVLEAFRRWKRSGLP